MMDSLDHNKFIKMLVTLWAIWTARRKAVHEGLFQSPISTFDFVKRFLDDLGEVHTEVQKRQAPVLAQRTRWSPPSPGVIKCNVDAAVSRLKDHGTVGVVCRDDTGRFVGASARTVNGVADPATLKAKACTEALVLAQDLGVRRLLCHRIAYQ
jgi:hypothetical protein